MYLYFVYKDVTWRTRHTLDAGTVEGQIAGVTVPKIGDEHMAKLYWRIKRDGKWTWVAATSENTEMCESNLMISYIGPYEVSYSEIVHDDEIVEKPEVISHLWDVNPGEEE